MPVRGKYKTHRREAVLEWFAAHPEDCVGAEAVYHALREQGESLGQTTVYRAIAALCSENRLRRYVTDGQDHSALYQFSPCTESHLHIRCMECGALEHLHCEEVDAFRVHLEAHHHFMLDEGKTILYGLCDNCRRVHA